MVYCSTHYVVMYTRISIDGVLARCRIATASSDRFARAFMIQGRQETELVHHVAGVVNLSHQAASGHIRKVLYLPLRCIVSY